MRQKSILTEAKQISRAVALIGLGARLQVLESETDLSYERLLRLYKEVAGKSPSKGQLPFSTDWFMTWQPNIHSSLFLNIYEYLNKTTELEEIDAIIKACDVFGPTTAKDAPWQRNYCFAHLTAAIEKGFVGCFPFAIYSCLRILVTRQELFLSTKENALAHAIH